MADRVTYGSATLGAITGDDFMDNVGSHIGRLYDAAAFALTSVAGVNDVTATLDPVLLAGLVDGMKVTLSWPAANTGAMTLALNGGAATPIVDVNGDAMAAASVDTGQRALLEYVGGSWRLLNASSGSGGGIATRYRQQFDASGTWTKPTDLDPDTIVMVEIWGGGGGGGSDTYAGGGGGGDYVPRFFRLGDLASSVSITVGAGGGVNAAGGASWFGTLAAAYGGGYGRTYNGGGGGGSGGVGGNASTSTSANNAGQGGGQFGAGANAGGENNNGGGGLAGENAGLPEAGGGGGTYNLTASKYRGGDSYYGGGGGGGGTAANMTGLAGGRSVYGGGGGGGKSGTGTNYGGESKYGGNGGDQNMPGIAPGGGGGRNAPGAAGRVVVSC